MFYLQVQHKFFFTHMIWPFLFFTGCIFYTTDIFMRRINARVACIQFKQWQEFILRFVTMEALERFVSSFLCFFLLILSLWSFSISDTELKWISSKQPDELNGDCFEAHKAQFVLQKNNKACRMCSMKGCSAPRVGEWWRSTWERLSRVNKNTKINSMRLQLLGRSTQSKKNTEKMVAKHQKIQK